VGAFGWRVMAPRKYGNNRVPAILVELSGPPHSCRAGSEYATFQIVDSFPEPERARLRRASSTARARAPSSDAARPHCWWRIAPLSGRRLVRSARQRAVNGGRRILDGPCLAPLHLFESGQLSVYFGKSAVYGVKTKSAGTNAALSNLVFTAAFASLTDLASPGLLSPSRRWPTTKR
jgi:hypothetical protein